MADNVKMNQLSEDEINRADKRYKINIKLCLGKGVPITTIETSAERTYIREDKMQKLSDKDKTEAREEFENQLRFAFSNYELAEEDDDNSELFLEKFMQLTCLLRK